jgi:ribonuclease HI
MKTIRVFCDGSGQKPDGTGSGIAWIREDSSQKHSERISGLTNNQAEYRAVISALRSLGIGSHAEILTDSELVCGQLMKGWKVNDPELEKLIAEVRKVSRARRLRSFKVSWIPRGKNRADKLLR